MLVKDLVENMVYVLKTYKCNQNIPTDLKMHYSIMSTAGRKREMAGLAWACLLQWGCWNTWRGKEQLSVMTVRFYKKLDIAQNA
jgi:hypothetical protein